MTEEEWLQTSNVGAMGRWPGERRRRIVAGTVDPWVMPWKMPAGPTNWFSTIALGIVRMLWAGGCWASSSPGSDLRPQARRQSMGGTLTVISFVAVPAFAALPVTITL